MRTSIIIAAHNEGDRLLKTLNSLFETTAGLEFETVVVDDGSTDGSVATATRRFSRLRIVTLPERLGTGAAKDLGARESDGDTLVFLDSHTRPERGAVRTLVERVEKLQGQAILVPKVPALDVEKWQNSRRQIGYGYQLDLSTFDSRWMSTDELRPASSQFSGLYESPGLIGCAFAMTRDLYDRLWGQDAGMRGWGVEDLDLGLKAWLFGNPVLVEPAASIGHRFQTRFANYEVFYPAFVANQLRMARKNFTDSIWSRWVEMARVRYAEGTDDVPEGIWTRAWTLFEHDRASVEEERSYLLGKRVHDEFWYARKFGLKWPAMGGEEGIANPLKRVEEAPPAPKIAHTTDQQLEQLPAWEPELEVHSRLPSTQLDPSPPPPPPPQPGVRPGSSPGSSIAGQSVPSRFGMPTPTAQFQMQGLLFTVSRPGYASMPSPVTTNAILLNVAKMNTTPAQIYRPASSITSHAALVGAGPYIPPRRVAVQTVAHGIALMFTPVGGAKISPAVQATPKSPTCINQSARLQSSSISPAAAPINYGGGGTPTINLITVAGIPYPIGPEQTPLKVDLLSPPVYTQFGPCIGRVYNPNSIYRKQVHCYCERNDLRWIGTHGEEQVYHYSGHMFLSSGYITSGTESRISVNSLSEFNNVINAFEGRTVVTTTAKIAVPARSTSVLAAQQQIVQAGCSASPVGWSRVGAGLGAGLGAGSGAGSGGWSLQQGECNESPNPLTGKSGTYQIQLFGDCTQKDWELVGSDQVVMSPDGVPTEIAIFRKGDGTFGWQLPVKKTTPATEVPQTQPQPATASSSTTCPVR